MRNCVILGSGRSGTSMVAGTLSEAGYFMGDNLLPSSPSNPKGFYEDIEINAINEAILDSVVLKRPPLIGNLLFRDRPLKYQRWLAQVPVNVEFQVEPKILVRLREMTHQVPFCYKDPRFSYTLPVWRPFLKDTVFICVFRHPLATAKSIIKVCNDDVRLHNLSMNRERALAVWRLMYSHILQIHSLSGEWLFLHFEQVLTHDGLSRLADFTQARIDESFPDKRLHRTIIEDTVPDALRHIYSQLCQLANYPVDALQV